MPSPPWKCSVHRIFHHEGTAFMNRIQSPTESNPLLEGGPSPAFDRIRAEHVAPAMRQILDELDAELQNLETQAQPTWSGLVEPLERLGDRLRVTWGIVGHLMGVKNSEELRRAYEDNATRRRAVLHAVGSEPGRLPGRCRNCGTAMPGTTCDATQQRIVEVLLARRRAVRRRSAGRKKGALQRHPAGIGRAQYPVQQSRPGRHQGILSDPE